MKARSLLRSSGQPSPVRHGRRSQQRDRGVDSVDIEANLADYLAARSPTDRYASFDYCFNYFQSYWEEERVAALACGAEMELSCLHLGFYLASWGMYRGSTVLLKRSSKYLEPVIEVIAASPQEIWVVDANDYSLKASTLILNLDGLLRDALPGQHASDALVTKIMLGVYGCVPAFDQNFRKGSGLTTFGYRALHQLGRFCEENAEIIERHRVLTLDFASGEPTGRRYSRAKVIDMIYFVEGSHTA